MRKPLCLIPTLFLLAIAGAPAAHADLLYDVSFTGTDAPSVVGSDTLAYSSNQMDFTTVFEIDILGEDIFLLPTDAVVESPSTDQYTWQASYNSNTFTITDTTESEAIYYTYGAFPGPMNYGLNAQGAVTMIQATPEASTSGLMLIGVGLLALMSQARRACL